MLDCLQVRPGSPDPRRAQAADLIRDLRQGLVAKDVTSDASIEVLVELVDKLSAAAPTVIVLDDLQWADLSSLKLIESLARDSEPTHVLFIGAYRDNEVDPTHPLVLTLDELRQAQQRIDGIEGRGHSNNMRKCTQ